MNIRPMRFEPFEGADDFLLALYGSLCDPQRLQAVVARGFADSRLVAEFSLEDISLILLTLPPQWWKSPSTCSLATSSPTDLATSDPRPEKLRTSVLELKSALAGVIEKECCLLDLSPPGLRSVALSWFAPLIIPRLDEVARIFGSLAPLEQISGLIDYHVRFRGDDRPWLGISEIACRNHLSFVNELLAAVSKRHAGTWAAQLVDVYVGKARVSTIAGSNSPALSIDFLEKTTVSDGGIAGLSPVLCVLTNILGYYVTNYGEDDSTPDFNEEERAFLASVAGQVVRYLHWIAAASKSVIVSNIERYVALRRGGHSPRCQDRCRLSLNVFV